MGISYKDPNRRTWDWAELFATCHTRFYKRFLKKSRRKKRREMDKKQLRKDTTP